MGIELVEMIHPCFMCKHRQSTSLIKTTPLLLTPDECKEKGGGVKSDWQTTFGPTGALPVLCALYSINLLN